jgi:site-specific DNA-cytosine methylase
MRSFAAWIALRLVLAEPIVIVEESDQLDPTILPRVMGDDYIVQWTLICATQLGWPVRRRRFWAVAVHKAFVLTTYTSLSNVVRLFERLNPGNVSFHVFRESSDEELKAELTWAVHRKDTGSGGMSVDDMLTQLEKPFRHALIPSEMANLVTYESTWPHRVYMLNQDADIMKLRSPSQDRITSLLLLPLSLSFSTHVFFQYCGPVAMLIYQAH